MRKFGAMALVSIAGMAMASAANADWSAASISDGDVFMRVPSGTGTTMNASTTSTASGVTADFRTTGATGTDHTFTNWWWYRANNDTRERALAAPTAAQAAVTKSTNGTSGVTYSNIQPETSGVNVDLRFTLSFQVVDLDGPGGNQGTMFTSLTVQNNGSAAAVNVNLYHYFDYFFTGEDAGDQANNTGVSGDTRFISIIDSTDTTVPSFGSMYHAGVGASAYTVGSFTVVGGQMGDTNIDNFSDLNSALTAGDQTGVMQWSFGDIPAGGSAMALASVTIIPAPGAAALLGLGGLIAGRRRRA